MTSNLGDPMAQEKTLDELNRLYSQAEEVDKDLFAEMRSNVLLVAGEHYTKVNSKVASGIRATGSNQKSVMEQKLRLTKNHMHRVSRSYVTAILSEAPGTTVLPQRDTELQDKKDAELNLAVWQHVKKTHDMKSKTRGYCKNFVDIGEVCVKVFWDPNAGEFKGYEQKIDEATGEPVLEPTGEIDPMSGQPVMGGVVDESKPIFSGDFVYEEVYGFNKLRSASMQKMDDRGEARFVRKMVLTEDLKAQYKGKKDIVDKIQSGAKETYIVFDGNKGAYERVKDQTLVREAYWPVCSEYPQGWFCYWTKDVKLEEGPLPFGIWPIAWEGFDIYATSPRGRSILKVARPYQAEINRASSKIAEAQVTLGDDKILYQSGTKLAPGSLLPGVRGVSYQGQTPTVLPGRDGSQYLPYVSSQIAELDQALMLDDMAVMDKSGQVDPYALLFKAASKKQKYSPYIEKFESFLIQLTTITLQLAKHYLPDDALIAAVGRREMINIPEFRKTSPLSTQISVEAQSETMETQFGRQLTFQNILQYAGKDLDPRTRGKLIKNMPFANYTDDFDDLTIDEDIADNDMLALERGEQVGPTKYVEPEFMAKKLTGRMKTPEFKFLPDPVKANYQTLVDAYEQIIAESQQKIIEAKNEYIPSDGTLVTLDMYIDDPKNPQNQSKRARLPQRSLEWLMQRLDAQGMSQDKLEGMNAGAMAEMAQMLIDKKNAGAAQPGMNNPSAPLQQMAG